MGFRKTKKENLTFEQKMEKEFPEFTDSVNTMNLQKMELELARYTKELQDSEEAKKAAKELETVKTHLYELEKVFGPFKDFKRDVNKKIKYLIKVSRSKGGS